MNAISRRSGAMLLLAALAMPAWSSASAQPMDTTEVALTVYGSPPADLSGLTAGPEIDGQISSRGGNDMRVTAPDGTSTVVHISDGTRVQSTGGFLGLDRDRLGADALLNGLPVSVRTVEWNGGLVATRIDLKHRDIKTAMMIKNGTAQGFAEQTAATDALRGRLADINKYNIKGTTNVNFDTGKATLSDQARNDLCNAAAQADATDNAMLLVVGYTDSTGSQAFNQTLSEKRAGRVVNYLEQTCGWKPYRMLTPTGMAEADPLADNSTAEGMAQNRRVAVNILVSKSVDGI